jgi:uncharacterized membrane protein
MSSEAAKARAVRRGPGAWGFLLAHHWPDQLDRCYQAWIGKRPVWFCSRCTGLYPVLFAVLVLQLLVGIPRGWWDLLLLFVLPAPALVDWALGRLGIRPGSNRGRTFWGMFLGASLGRMIYLNMIDPANTLVVIQIAALVGVLVLVESARPFVIRRREAGP